MNPFEELTELFDGGKRWLQGDTVQGAKRCESGMMSLVPSASPWVMQEVAAKVIKEQYPERLGMMGARPTDVGAIVAFNDHQDTVYADVERVNDKARVLWDEVYG